MPPSSSTSYDPWYNDDLLGCTIKLFNTLYRFTRFYFESGRTAHAFFVEDSLGLSDSRQGLRVVRLYFIQIPREPVVAATGHDP